MTNDARLSIEVTEIAGVPVVRAHGEIDLYTVPEFEQALDVCLARQTQALIADLSETTYLDSSGLSALIHAYKALSGRNGGLYVVAPPQTPGVRRVLEITRLDTVFQVSDTVEDAVAHIHDAKSE